MKRIKLLLAALLVALPVLAWAAVAHAQSFQTGNNITVAQNETVDKTLIVAGRTIDIAGTVNGDLFCAGQSINISGTINGDVMCAGQDINITGVVNGSVRAAGQDVILGGTIARNLTSAGQNVTVESDAKVLGDAMLGSQDVTINGSIGRDLASGATTVTINGEIGRDVQTQSMNLKLGKSAIVGGGISYISAQTLSRADGARVAGTITRTEPTKAGTQRVELGAFIRGGFWFAVYLFFALLAVAMLLALIMPQVFHMATETAMNEPLKTVLVGLIASIAAPVLVCAFMFTVLGIPFSLVLLTAWMLAVALAGPFAAYYFGRLLVQLATAKPADNALLVMLVGAGALLVLYFIPFVGAVVSFVALWFGLGIIVMQAPRLPRPHYALTNKR